MSKIRVLAVDDEPYLLDLTKIFLENDPRILVDLAGSGQEALTLVGTTFYDCLISDYQMPSMDGLELLKSLRTSGWDVPFILFTGKGREDVAVNALNLGASFYLQKGGGVEAQFTELANMVRRSAEIYRSKRELEESENRFRNLLQQSSDFILIIDPEGFINYCSSSVKRIVGRSDEEMLGKNVFDLIHPDDFEEMKVRLERIRRNESGGDPVEFRIMMANGECSPMEAVGANMMDVPSVEGLVITVRPITERKKAENDLRESEEAYKTLFEKSPFPIALCTLDGTFVDVNEKHLQVTGTRKEDIIGKGAVELGYVGPEDFQNISEAFLNGEGVIDQHPLEIRSPGGEVLKMLLSSRLIRYRGEPHIINVLNDVTDLISAQKALELKNEELNEERNRLQMIADQSPGVVYQLFLKDDVPKFIFVSKGAELFVDVPTDKWLKDPSWMFDRILPEERSQFVEAMRTSERSGQMCRHEFRLRDFDGTVRWILNTSSMSQKKDGGTVWTGTFTDITERKRSEEAVKQVNRQLSLISNITHHDCLNKIVATEGYIDLAARIIEDDATIDLLDKAQRSIEAIRSEMDLTHDLQELSGYDAQWVRIRDAIPEMTSQHPVRMPEAFHHLEVFSNPMLPKVFMNLVDNSVRHGVCATDLWIECAEDPAGLIIAFNDNGVGIPSADKERIFNRGYGKNTGLGLFLVREVLKFTNISIIENGSEGQGARFELKVPPGSYRFTDLQ